MFRWIFKFLGETLRRGAQSALFLWLVKFGIPAIMGATGGIFIFLKKVPWHDAIGYAVIVCALGWGCLAAWFFKKPALSRGPTLVTFEDPVTIEAISALLASINEDVSIVNWRTYEEERVYCYAEANRLREKYPVEKKAVPTVQSDLIQRCVRISIHPKISPWGAIGRLSEQLTSLNREIEKYNAKPSGDLRAIRVFTQQSLPALLGQVEAEKDRKSEKRKLRLRHAYPAA